MNGNDRVLDTNVVIGYLRGDNRFIALVDGGESPKLHISAISRMELLSFPDLSGEEEKRIRLFLAYAAIHPITAEIEDRDLISQGGQGQVAGFHHRCDSHQSRGRSFHKRQATRDSRLSRLSRRHAMSGL